MAIRCAALTWMVAVTVTVAVAEPPSLTLDEHDGALRLRQDGTKLSEKPLRIIVQEWKVSGAKPTAQKADSAGVNNVGSIIESAPIQDGSLQPVGNAWLEEATTTIRRDGEGYTSTTRHANDLSVEASYRQLPDHLVVSGKLINSGSGASRENVPVTLSLVIPIDEQPLNWLSDLHRTEVADHKEERINAVATMAGARGSMSRYPFGAVSGEHAQVALALPLDQPRIHRIRWDGAHAALIAEVDLTVSRLTEKFPAEVPFEFWIFPFEKEWGLRSVAAEYYALTPDSYLNRARRQGLWMAFSQIDKVQRPEDFRFAYHEYHPNVSVAYNAPNGIESLVYCEPVCQYVNLDATFPKETEALRKYIQGLDTRQGSQLRTSITTNSAREIQSAWVVTPWATGARVPTNGDPELPRTERDPWNSFDVNWLPYIDLYRYRSEDQPVDWQGSGLLVDGVIGTDGRCLHLAAGESARQSGIEITASGSDLSLTIVAKGDAEANATVRLSASGATVEKQLTLPTGLGIPTPVTITFSAGEIPAGALDLSLDVSAGELWIDRIESQDVTLRNADFESGTHDKEAVTGLYLDSFEGWDAKDLNFRRDHLRKSDYPLTFDARTGEVAQVIMMHNFELAAEARQRLHKRNQLLMANTALYQWCWSAHFLDVLGIETSWGESEDIIPPKVQEMDYLRTMLYQKPYCYLQNVRFDRFRGKKIEQYFARCFHYGFWPGFFSFNAAEFPYWEDARLYNEDRPVFLKYMQPQGELTEAGWEPVTFAHLSDPELLLERWGGGVAPAADDERRPFAFTIYNPTTSERSATLTIDKSLQAAGEYLVLSPLDGRRASYDPVSGSLALELSPYSVAACLFIPREETVLAESLSSQAQLLNSLADKYHRHAMLTAAPGDIVRPAAPNDLSDFNGKVAQVRSAIEPLYHEEWDRAVTRYRVLYAALTESRRNLVFAPQVPRALALGESAILRAGAGFEDQPLTAVVTIGQTTLTGAFAHGECTLPIPSDLPPGAKANLLLRGADIDSGFPWYESTLDIRDALSFVSIPGSLSIGETGTLSLSVLNNLQVEQVGELVVEGPSQLKPVAVARLTLPPGTVVDYTTALSVQDQPESADLKTTLKLHWNRAGKTISAGIPVTLLPKNASLLRASNVSIVVDSSYYGYDTAPLVDGVIDTRDIDWKQAAWASDEGAVPHWVEFDFGAPKTIAELQLHWAQDGGEYWTSAEVRIEVRPVGSNQWSTVAEHRDPTITPSSRFTFDPVEADRLRIYQPAGKGPLKRAGILWLSEVEAR
jgi:hypothetical protein